MSEWLLHATARSTTQQRQRLICSPRSAVGGRTYASGMTTTPIADVLSQALDDGDAPAQRGRHLPTGFAALDEALAGGLRTGQTTMVASRSGDGASAFALGLARAATFRNGLPSAVLAPDTPEREIALRAIAGETMVPALSLRSGQLSPGDADRLAEHRERLATARMSINAGSPQVWGPDVFLDSLDYMTSDSGVRLAVIDGVSRLGPSLRAVLPHMSALSRRRNFALVLVAGATPTHGIASRPPTIEDLRDHDSLTDLVDLVLMIQRADFGEASVSIVKHRYGPTATIPIGVLDHYGTFVDVDGTGGTS